MPTLDSLNIPVRYADEYAMAEYDRYGYLRAEYLTDRPTYETDVKIFDLSIIAMGTDAYGQTPTYKRANHRSLTADYPDTFADVKYSNVDALAILATNVTDDIADLLLKLADEYAVYDEEAMSALEEEEITESVSAYVISDIAREFDEVTRERWDDLTTDEQVAMVFNACAAVDYYPEHNGLEVCWRYEAILPTLTARLTADR